MPTDKPRLQITLDEDVNALLSLLAKKQKKSRAEIVNAMVEDALDVHEDAYWISLIKERESRKGKRVPYSKDIWD